MVYSRERSCFKRGESASTKFTSSNLRVFGASSIAGFEIDYALSMIPNYFPLDFNKMQTTHYDYVSLSKNYFVAKSIDSMKNKFFEVSQTIKNKKPWIKFDKNTKTFSIEESKDKRK